jgi:hypothetical protein
MHGEIDDLKENTSRRGCGRSDLDRADRKSYFPKQYTEHSQPSPGSRRSACDYHCPQRAVAGAKVLAASVVDFLTNPQLVAEAKATFKKETAGFECKSFLPQEQKPRIHLNKELMELYRPLLTKYYVKEKRKFE